MAALTAGKIAPTFELTTAEGQKFSLKEALARGPVLVGFFKVSCPVCHLTFPYIERIFQSVKDKAVTVIGVSQDDRDATVAFNKQFGLTFPVALDDTRKYFVSNAYGLTNVPTAFLITPDGKIGATMVGWSRQELEAMNRDLAAAAGVPAIEVVRKGEQVPDFKPG